MNAHSAMLTDMRLPDQVFPLDSSAMSRNPIIKRRKAPDQGCVFIFVNVIAICNRYVFFLIHIPITRLDTYDNFQARIGRIFICSLFSALHVQTESLNHGVPKDS